MKTISHKHFQIYVLQCLLRFRCTSHMPDTDGTRPLQEWKFDEVQSFIKGLELDNQSAKYAALMQKHKVDGLVLSMISSSDLKDLGITILGHRLKILNAINILRPGNVYKRSNFSPLNSNASSSKVSDFSSFHSNTSSSSKQNFDYYKSKGNQSLSQGKYEEAVQHYTEAANLGFLKSNDEMVRIYSNRSGAYFGLKRYAEALQDADKAIEIKPDFINAYVRKAKVLLATTGVKAACDIYIEAKWNCPANEVGSQQSIETILIDAMAQKLEKENQDAFAYANEQNLKKIFRVEAVFRIILHQFDGLNPVEGKEKMSTNVNACIDQLYHISGTKIDKYTDHGQRGLNQMTKIMRDVHFILHPDKTDKIVVMQDRIKKMRELVQYCSERINSFLESQDMDVFMKKMKEAEATEKLKQKNIDKYKKNNLKFDELEEKIRAQENTLSEPEMSKMLKEMLKCLNQVRTIYAEDSEHVNKMLVKYNLAMSFYRSKDWKHEDKKRPLEEEMFGGESNKKVKMDAAGGNSSTNRLKARRGFGLCPYCRQEFPVKLLKRHKTECPEVYVSPCATPYASDNSD